MTKPVTRPRKLPVTGVVASSTRRHPTIVAYLGTDNSAELHKFRVDRERALNAIREKQQIRTYKQLVRALNSALGQTKTKTKRASSSVKSRTTTKTIPSKLS